MAKFLRTSGISHKIEEIIINAKKELIIVSPYLKISNNLFERLKEKSEEGIRISFVYGKSALSSAEREKIETLESIKIYYYQNLHAKCYYNEHEMIITSMNLYEFSEKNNREMGVLINSIEDFEMFEEAVQEVKSIIAASQGAIIGEKFTVGTIGKKLGFTKYSRSLKFNSNGHPYVTFLTNRINSETNKVIAQNIYFSVLASKYLADNDYDDTSVIGPEFFKQFKMAYVRCKSTPEGFAWKFVTDDENV
ncbi:phospholipase D family protein [Pontibacter kalidii]|uniref:phospholipase D family protein n=1 Tax=Pontibacter kalidii TaxID=2592049 RepID=UPI0022525F8C|nr:phospholipase D family protein [Pontibacter kalidii]